MERKLEMYVFGDTDAINVYINKKLFEYEKLYKQNLVGTVYNEITKILKHDTYRNRLEFYKRVCNNRHKKLNKNIRKIYYYDKKASLYREKAPDDKVNPYKVFIEEKTIFRDYIENRISTDTEAFDSRFCSFYNEYIESLINLNDFILHGNFEEAILITHTINKCELLMSALMELNEKQIKLYSTKNRYRSEINFKLDLIRYAIERNLI